MEKTRSKEDQKLSNIQFTISSAAYILAFFAVCVAVGFSRNVLMLINGIFFIVDILSLWKTGMDTYEFYSSKYFIVDMISVAIYANIPSLFIRTFTDVDFMFRCLILLTLNETICIVWDFFCFDKTKSNQAKKFHVEWVILTAIGIIIMIFIMLFVKLTNIGNVFINLLLLDIFAFLYQFILLSIWWYSEYKIKRSHSQ